MWGQVIICKLDNGNVRIIPTRVGTSYFCLFCCCHTKDHPHACGDKKNQYYDTQKKVGSSPRVWGQDQFAVCIRQELGIIPTRVGTRRFDFGKHFFLRDHPHACGDKDFRHISDTRFAGSSPRVWGQGCCEWTQML